MTRYVDNSIRMVSGAFLPVYFQPRKLLQASGAFSWPGTSEAATAHTWTRVIGAEPERGENSRRCPRARPARRTTRDRGSAGNSAESRWFESNQGRFSRLG